MKKYLLVTAIIIFCLGMGGCEKYLDVVPQNVGTLDHAFRNRNEAEKYLFTCYSALQKRSNMMNDPWFATGGELLSPLEYNGQIFYSRPGLHLVKGDVQNIDNPVLDYWGGTELVPSYFKAIRQCNIFLENIDKPIDLQEAEKQRWIAEVNFLKAYYHFFLVKMYGPIPIVEENVSIAAPTEETRPARESVEAVLDYVVTLLDEASPSLPVQIADPERELGRITRIIAMTLKAEVLVAKASPLFNGNPDYAHVVDKEGNPLFSQTVDNTLWTDAANACKEAIDLAESNGLGLYTFVRSPIVPATLTDSLVNTMNFRAAITENWDKNKELIWALNGTFPDMAYMYPVLQPVTDLTVAHNTLVVPFAVTELFYTKNGVPIEEDRTWDYANRFSPAKGDADHRFYLKEGYESIRHNFDREARYYASIGFDGGTWFGNGVYDQDNLLSIQSKGSASLSGVSNPRHGNIFGIWAKKLCNYMTVRRDGSLSNALYRLPLMRMADLYLLYAECLNEANGPSEEAYQYIDLVRGRTGLRGVVESWGEYAMNASKPLTKEGLREIIQKERRIELCFEGKAGWDLRRWKTFMEAATAPIRGWQYAGKTTSEYYQLQTYYVPAITIKDYLWPISSDELLINSNLVQNPYW